MIIRILTELVLDDFCVLKCQSVGITTVTQSDSYLTVPEVFRRTEAAKLWVTPTKLVPSTSTIRSFTWILEEAVKRQRQGFTVIARVWPLFIIFILEPTRSQTPFVSARSWQPDPRAAAKNERVERDNEASAPGNKNYNR